MSRASNKSLLDLSQNKMRGSQPSVNSNPKPSSNSVSGLNTVYSLETQEISLIQGLNTKEPTEYILPQKESAEQLKLPAVKQAQATDKDERTSLHSYNSSISRLAGSNTKISGSGTNVAAKKGKTNGATKSQSQPPSSKNASRADDLKLKADSTASLSIHLADSPTSVDRNSPKKTEFLNEDSTNKLGQKEIAKKNQDKKTNGKQEPLPKKNGKQEPTPKLNGKPEPQAKLNGKPDPTPKLNGKPEPTPKLNGKPVPSPRFNEKKEATPKPNGKPEPTPRQNGKPEPSPRQNGKPDATPRDKPGYNKAPAKGPAKGPEKAPAPGKGGDPKQSEDMRRNNQASMARNPTGTYTDQHNSTNPNPVKNYDPKATGKNQAQNPFGVPPPWMGYNPWMGNPWGYPYPHMHPHPVAYPPTDPSAMQNYHMNLWMKPYLADWQQGKNQEELPFYFGLENSSYIHKWKTTDEGKQAVAKIEAKEAKENLKREKAEKAEQLKIEKAEKAKLAEQKKKEKLEKLAKDKEMEAENKAKEAERAAKEAEDKAKETAEAKAKAEAEKLEKAEQLKKEKAKEVEEKAKSKEAATKAKEAELKAKGTPNKPAVDAKNSPSNSSKPTKPEEKKEPETKPGTSLPVIKKATNETAKKGPANSKTNSVVSLPKEINKTNDSTGKKSSQALLVESVADFTATPRNQSQASKLSEPKKSDNLPAEAAKTTNRTNANAKSFNQNKNGAPTSNGSIKQAKSLNLVAKPSNNLAPKPAVQAQPIKS